jgi:hypothetical protein
LCLQNFMNPNNQSKSNLKPIFIGASLLLKIIFFYSFDCKIENFIEICFFSSNIVSGSHFTYDQVVWFFLQSILKMYLQE